MKMGQTMANYHKEFLVPYLRDISALQLALNKLEQQFVVLEQQKASLEADIRFAEIPRKPCYEAANGVFLLGCGIYGFLLSIMMFFNGIALFAWLCILCGIMGITLGTIRYILVTRENTQKEDLYERQFAEYLKIQRQNQQHQNSISALSMEIQECRAEIISLKSTLTRVYDTHIIPKPLQNMDAAVFLYVWFASDRPNDLPMALKAFVHKEIRERLDRIIANRAESFLKPYLRLAEGQQDPTAATMRSQLSQMEVTADERSAYLAMIDSNIITTACFATAKYLSQL